LQWREVKSTTRAAVFDKAGKPPAEGALGIIEDPTVEPVYIFYFCYF
jgi:hypothetical protein